MGLDMYLTRRSYVQNWSHTKPEHRHEITVLRGGVLRDDIKPERISYIIEQVAYWRKANAIHKWFVDHVQGGKDDCQESYVEPSQLRELVGLCKQVLVTVETVEGDIQTGKTYYPDGKVVENSVTGQVVAQPGVAEKLLPTQEGFFFGSTEYSQYYLEDLRRTVEQLEPLLDDTEGEYYYRASW